VQNRSENLRTFFASYVAAAGGVAGGPIERAFAAVRREDFAGPRPWSIKPIPSVGPGPAAYVETPNDDVAFLYQDALVALDAKRGINIGQPSAHAGWLGALQLQKGETVLQVGAGTGYYTAILSHLVGEEGRVYAYEIDPYLAGRAQENLKSLPQAEIRARSGIADNLPKVEAIYVCAGITQPCWAWLDALKPGGRLIFPLQAELVPGGALGGMLMITRAWRGPIWPARFVSRAGFIPCVGPQDAETGRRLTTAYAEGGFHSVRSFRLDEPIDRTCWFAGDGWWLSTLACDVVGA
jgi:protein-L-isoaspartate(D-aspartate) O-methyltransferase